MKEISVKEKNLDMEFINMLIVPVMKENGSMIIKMEQAHFISQMVIYIKDYFLMVRETELGFISTQMGMFMMVHFI